MLFSPIFTKGIKAKLNELESESDIFPQNEGKVGKSELTPVVKALTNCALAKILFRVIYHFHKSFCHRPATSCLPYTIEKSEENTR